MKKTLVLVIVLVVIAIAAYFLVFKKSEAPLSPSTPDNTQSTPVNNTQPTVPNNPASASVEIKNFAFNPGTVTVKVGTKVTWTNNDSAPHTVTSDSGSPLNSKSILSPGQSFSYTFTTAGTFPYHCTIHPTMKGQVVVTS